jgi:hypothetical protein
MFWNWLFQTCAILKEIHGMCKHRLMVVFHILLQNVYNFFEQCKTFFVNFYICPSPCCPFNYFVNLPFPFYSPCSKFKQILKGVYLSWITWIFQRFYCHFAILFSMLEINVYSIIVSKVFGVTIHVNFHFAIVK